MLEREPDGALAIAGDDQRSDLDHLALSPCGRTRLVLCGGNVGRCSASVAATRSRHREQGELDGEMSHVDSVRQQADAELTSH